MRDDKITRSIVLLPVVFLLLISVQGEASKTEDYQYIKKFEKIDKSLGNNVENLNQLMMSLSISSLTGDQGSKNKLLVKIRRIESRSENDFETLSNLNPSYKFRNLHTKILDLTTSFHFMVQVCEKILKNTELDAMSAPSDIEQKITKPYKQMQSLITGKYRKVLTELESLS